MDSFDILDKTLIEEYFFRLKRKKEDEQWLKENGEKIKEIMLKNSLKKAQVGKFVVSVSVPDYSNFDMMQVKEKLKTQYPEIFEHVKKEEVDEEKLEEILEKQPELLEVLKDCWVEKKGTPRITINIIEEDD